MTDRKFSTIVTMSTKCDPQFLAVDVYYRTDRATGSTRVIRILDVFHQDIREFLPPSVLESLQQTADKIGQILPSEEGLR